MWKRLEIQDWNIIWGSRPYGNKRAEYEVLAPSPVTCELSRDVRNRRLLGFERKTKIYSKIHIKILGRTRLRIYAGLHGRLKFYVNEAKLVNEYKLSRASYAMFIVIP